MKKVVIISLLLILIISNGFAQIMSYSDLWSDFTQEEKLAFIVGFTTGIEYAEIAISEMPTETFSSKLNQKMSAGTFTSIYTNFYNEKIFYWIGAVDSFYLEETNRNQSFAIAFRSVYDKYIKSK